MRGADKSSLGQIIPGKNPLVTKQPKKGRYLGQNDRAPNRRPERIMRERGGVQQRISFLRGKHALRCIAPSEDVRFL